MLPDAEGEDCVHVLLANGDEEHTGTASPSSSSSYPLEDKERCCIMSELEIRVRTRLRKLTDTDQVILSDCHPTRTTRRDRQADEFIRPVYKNRVTIELCPDDFQMMQKDNLEDVIDIEISDDEVMMDEEESDTFEGFDSSPMSASSQSDSLNNAISSPINIPGNSDHAPQARRLSSGTPSQCSGYFGRMFPVAQSDSGSPLSSGYGSASRFFHSTSTQTPSTPVFCETLIRLRILSFSGDERQQTSRRLRIQPQEGRVRNRAYSENNSDDLREEGAEAEDSGASSAMPLPDVVAFRDRSNSAPTNLMRPEISVGRELRRISDEFHFSYHERQMLRARQHQNILQRLRTILQTHHQTRHDGSPV